MNHSQNTLRRVLKT